MSLMNASNKKAVYQIIALVVVIIGVVLFSVSRDNVHKDSDSKEFLEDQIAELELQNQELEEQNEEQQQLLDEQEEKEQAMGREKAEAAMCFREYFELIYPYYGYNDNAYEFCITKLMPTYTLAKCQQSYNDRIAELDADVEEAKRTCNYKE